MSRRRPRAWYLSQRITETPNEFVLPQKIFASLQDSKLHKHLNECCASRFFKLPVVDVVHVAEDSGTGFCDVSVHETSEGGLVIRVPITWVAFHQVINSLFESLQPLERQHFEKFPTLAVAEAIIEEGTFEYSIRAQCTHLVTDLYERMRGERKESAWTREVFSDSHVQFAKMNNHNVVRDPMLSLETYVHAASLVSAALSVGLSPLDTPTRPNVLFQRYLPMDERFELLEEICRKWQSHSHTSSDGTVSGTVHFAWGQAILHEYCHWQCNHFVTRDATQTFMDAVPDLTVREITTCREYLADQQALTNLKTLYLAPDLERDEPQLWEHNFGQLYIALALSYGLMGVADMATRKDLDMQGDGNYPLPWTRWAFLSRTLSSEAPNAAAETRDTFLRFVVELGHKAGWPEVCAIGDPVFREKFLSNKYYDTMQQSLSWHEWAFLVTSRIAAGDSIEQILTESSPPAGPLDAVSLNSKNSATVAEQAQWLRAYRSRLFGSLPIEESQAQNDEQ